MKLIRPKVVRFLIFLACCAVFSFIYQQSSLLRNVALGMSKTKMCDRFLGISNDDSTVTLLRSTEFSNSVLPLINEEDFCQILLDDCEVSTENFLINTGDVILPIEKYKTYLTEKFVKAFANPFPPNHVLPPLNLRTVSIDL